MLLSRPRCYWSHHDEYRKNRHISSVWSNSITPKRNKKLPCLSITRRGRVTHIPVSTVWLVTTKSLSAPELAYCKLDVREHVSVKYASKFIDNKLWKWLLLAVKLHLNGWLMPDITVASWSGAQSLALSKLGIMLDEMTNSTGPLAGKQPPTDFLAYQIVWKFNYSTAMKYEWIA